MVPEDSNQEVLQECSLSNTFKGNIPLFLKRLPDIKKRNIGKSILSNSKNDGASPSENDILTVNNNYKVKYE